VERFDQPAPMSARPGINGLINNVLDFARGRLGGGLSLHRYASDSLEQTLTQIIDEWFGAGAVCAPQMAVAEGNDRVGSSA
jgi:hypothetical protein